MTSGTMDDEDAGYNPAEKKKEADGKEERNKTKETEKRASGGGAHRPTRGRIARGTREHRTKRGGRAQDKKDKINTKKRNKVNVNRRRERKENALTGVESAEKRE